jgi:hypothetical protein
MLQEQLERLIQSAEQGDADARAAAELANASSSP